MERLTPSGLTGVFNTAYLANYTAVINHITSSGGWAVLDPHNYGRFNDAIITDTAGFQTWWKNFATQFKGNDHVIFDTNNEYNTMDQTLVLNLNQAAINGIRAAGATQYIFVEGNQWSGAWSWTTVNDNMKALTDPQNKIVYEMHQYLDSDSSGTSDACVSTTIGVERVTAATTWLRQNGKIGILGEFAGGANTQCQTAVKGMLDYLKANSDVWTGESGFFRTLMNTRLTNQAPFGGLPALGGATTSILSSLPAARDTSTTTACSRRTLLERLAIGAGVGEALAITVVSGMQEIRKRSLSFMDIQFNTSVYIFNPYILNLPSWSLSSVNVVIITIDYPGTKALQA